MIAGFVASTSIVLAVVGVLFKVNHDYCKRNEGDIKENREGFHAVDKKLDILINTLEIKYPDAVKKARANNGDNS